MDVVMDTVWRQVCWTRDPARWGTCCYIRCQVYL